MEAFIAEQERISAVRAVRHVSVLFDAPSHIDFGVAMRTNLNDHLFGVIFVNLLDIELRVTVSVISGKTTLKTGFIINVDFVTVRLRDLLFLFSCCLE